MTTAQTPSQKVHDSLPTFYIILITLGTLAAVLGLCWFGSWIYYRTKVVHIRQARSQAPRKNKYEWESWNPSGPGPKKQKLTSTERAYLSSFDERLRQDIESTGRVRRPSTNRQAVRPMELAYIARRDGQYWEDVELTGGAEMSKAWGQHSRRR